jgi:single-strand DNA-binding protein
MNGLNQVIIMGNLGADPELRVAAGGVAVLKMRVATNESWQDKTNQWQERTEWHRVTVFGKRAEVLARFLRKGMCVTVSGQIRTSSYEKEGQKHYSTEIVAMQVHSPNQPTRGAEAGDGAGADAPFAPSATLNGSSYGRSPAAAAIDIPF